MPKPYHPTPKRLFITPANPFGVSDLLIASQFSNGLDIIRTIKYAVKGLDIKLRNLGREPYWNDEYNTYITEVTYRDAMTHLVNDSRVINMLHRYCD